VTDLDSPVDSFDAGGREVMPRLELAILLIGATGIAFEIALVRVFSISQWHHFAFMIISMALLGFALSGTVLGLMGDRVRGGEQRLLRIGAFLLPVALIVCYEASQAIPFETLQLTTRPGQWVLLVLLYLTLSAPFFLVSWCIATALLLRPDRVGRVYFANMVGSGLGAVGAVGSLFFVSADAVPYVLAFVAFSAFLLVAGTDRRWLAAGTVFAVAAGASLVLRGPVPIRVSEYKGLSYAMRLPDARIVAQKESPLSRLTAVQSSLIRETPGQVSGYPMERLGVFPEQVGLFFDGGGVSPVHRFDGSLERFAFLDYVTSALPYQLVRDPRVLVIGAGGGTEVLSALAHGAVRVTAVELDPGVPEVIDLLGSFSGGLYGRQDVDLVIAEGRGFLEAHPELRVDVLQIALLDAFNASSAGVHALNESYLYTVEALALYVSRLSDDGVLAITRWLKTPPRDAIKLFATAVEASRVAGIEDPGRHLALIRSWNTATLVISRAPLDAVRTAAIREFAESRGFDVSWLWDLEASETNRFIVLEQPVYYLSAEAILSPDAEGFFRRYPFHVRPATDDRPYFFRFFRWRSLSTLVSLAGRDWLNYVEWGYLVLAATVAQALAAAVLLVLLPLALFRRGREVATGRASLMACFAALGVAFMFLEIAFIQKLMLFLHHPVYAVSVVLATFLLFAGLGSLYADRRRSRPVRRVMIVVLMLAVLSAIYLVALPPLFRALAGWPAAGRVAVSVAILSPLAFLMGIPFPTCLQAVSDRARGMVAWAWGVNGAASVVGVTVATLVAVHAGFRIVVLAAVLLYFTVPLSLRSMIRRPLVSRPTGEASSERPM
jgi:spermidine synthase